MLARLLLTLMVVWGLTGTGMAQDKKSNKDQGELNKKVVDQVRKSLRKFEKQLGEKKVNSIVDQVKAALEGNHFHSFQVKPGKGVLQWNVNPGAQDLEQLQKHLKALGVDGKSGIAAILAESGKKRKMLGVMLKAENDGPVEVSKVIEGSAAEKAGLKEGDVILKVNGKKVDNPQTLVDSVQKTDGKIKVTVKRNKKEMVIEVEPRIIKGDAVGSHIIELDLLERELIPHEQLKLLLPGKGNGIFLFKDGDFTELDGEIRKKLGVAGGSLNDARKKIEIHLDKAQENAKKHQQKIRDAQQKIEQRIEIRSDLGETLEKLQKQVQQLQTEIENLKKSKRQR